MSLVGGVMGAIAQAIKPFEQMIEYVTDIVMDSGGSATMNGAKSDDDDGHPISAAVLWQLGFYSVPLDGASGIVVKAGGKGGASFLLGWRNKQYEISLQKGECAMANEAGAVVKLDKNGKITATAKAGQTVDINGADYSLLKTETLLSDLNTLVTNLATWVPLAVTGISTGPAGSAPDPGIVTAAATITSAISGGSYKSTKAKNG